jgi:hypothetical protein
VVVGGIIKNKIMTEQRTNCDRCQGDGEVGTTWDDFGICPKCGGRGTIITMDINEAINAVYVGKTITCTTDEYTTMRTSLQEQAAKWIDQGNGMRAIIMLEEIKRLDQEHGIV